MHVYGRITGKLTPLRQITGTLTPLRTITGTLIVPTDAATPIYTGAYEFTPTQDAQTVLISGLKATQDITINPIPSNYGLITWNGSFLTVS